jgi:hypothetical protein
VLPAGWRERLVPLRNANTGNGTGLCVEIHDLVVSKLVAGREKDLDFIAGVLRHGLAETNRLRERLQQTPLAEDRRALCEHRLRRLESGRNG